MLKVPGTSAESGIRLADVAADLSLRRAPLANSRRARGVVAAARRAARSVARGLDQLPRRRRRCGPPLSPVARCRWLGASRRCRADRDGPGLAVFGRRPAHAVRGPSSGYHHVSFADVYEDFGRQQHQRPPNEFKDKIVIVGTAASGLQDLRVTPLSHTYPGVEILATAIDT